MSRHLHNSINLLTLCVMCWTGGMITENGGSNNGQWIVFGACGVVGGVLQIIKPKPYRTPDDRKNITF